MTSVVNAMRDLLLVDGMEVEVRGQLVVRERELVVTGYQMLPHRPGLLPELRWELTPFVPLEMTPDQEVAFEELLGETVYGRGIWSSGAVELHSLVADDSWARQSVLEGLPYRKDLTPVSDEIRSVEAGLFASGAMLRRVRIVDEEGLRVVAVVTDVDAVRSALGPIYGSALEVLSSRWEAWQIRALDDVLNDLPEDKVLKVEFRMNGDGVISRKLRVNYVDAALVHDLGRFPDEILAVEAVVEPLGMPQHRDIWFPPRARGETPGVG